MTDAKTKFFSRLEANNNKERHNWQTTTTNTNMLDDDTATATAAAAAAAAAVVSSAELELLDNFALTENSKTTSGSSGQQPQLAFGTMDDLDFSVTSSGRTIEHVFSTFLSERSAGTIGTFALSERSGSIAEDGNTTTDANNRMEATTQAATAATASVVSATSTSATAPSNAVPSSSQTQPQPSQSYSNGSMGAALEEHHQQPQRPRQESFASTHNYYQPHQQQRPRQESFASINSSTTATEPLPQFQLNHSTTDTTGMPPRSRPMTIPSPSKQQQQHPTMMSATSASINIINNNTTTTGGSGTVSQASSAGSSGSAFLNNILTTNHTIMAHTPPSHIATSYEASHFGKRPRANSVSERLRYPTELEEKGLIDPHQKAILKDLIISGDNDLQLALDQYEQGNSAVLENMIRGGSISNRNASDIDLLGDLDLDFLTVNDHEQEQMMGAAEAAGVGSGSTARLRTYSVGYGGGGGKGATAIPGLSSTTANAFGGTATMAPPLPTTTTSSSTSATTAAVANHPGAPPSDGIGELDFDGGFGSTMYNNMPPSQIVARGEEAPTMFDIRSRSNSTWSVDFDPRTRSNSLFNALLGDTSSLASAAQAMEDQTMEDNSNSNMDHNHSSASNIHNNDNSADYGRWMEQRPEPPTKPVRIRKVSRRASAPELPSNLSLSLSKKDQQSTKPQKKQYKKKNGQQQQKQQQQQEDMLSDEMPNPPTEDGAEGSRGVLTMKNITATMSKEQKAEERSRVKQEKKEQRERERLEKKEKREQAKLEKQQKKKQDQLEAEKMAVVHIPGSGRPRSLSDSNLVSTVDADGLLEVERPDGWIGAYSPESRKTRIERFMEKRKHRVWTQSVKYDVRKNFADSRLRVKGRFVKKEDELLMRELMSLT